MTKPTTDPWLIESDAFPFEFLSEVGERESWRKEIHRPIYHLHKWWAKRLGSIFRGILLGTQLDDGADLREAFYATHDFRGVTVLDPFMGSGTTIGEAHKLGLTALGRDINPVAVESVRVALGPMDREAIAVAYETLDAAVGKKIRDLYRTTDSDGKGSDVLYHFWVMEASCPKCAKSVDLFSSYVFAQNAYPKRKPEVRVVCPSCGDIFEGLHARTAEDCPSCDHHFDPQAGNAKASTATCPHCADTFSIIDAVSARKQRPDFRLYAKLVLRDDGRKEYLRATAADVAAYQAASTQLEQEVASGAIVLPDLRLETGYNTAQAMRYGFTNWRDFFNDRQLLALGWLRASISEMPDRAVRAVMMTLSSGLLEFNNLFASYKGEGTGAVRHMFSHHILKPERTPIEANVWGTPKSSGSFSGLYRWRLGRAMAYRDAPTEVKGGNGEKAVVASPAFSGEALDWPVTGNFKPRGIYLSCGDSSVMGLLDKSMDFVVTDPPFFDNVHYSELADFFYAWKQIGSAEEATSTRSDAEVQDTDADEFSDKLQGVFRECHRVLKDQGLLVFTYHHSRDEGWESLAYAVLGAGFVVVNSQPVKAEMSGATPVAAAKDPGADRRRLRSRPLADNWRDSVLPASVSHAATERLCSSGSS
jgi:putative DNA methylase